MYNTRPWDQGFDHWVAQYAVREHTRDEAAWKFLVGLGTGGAAIVATFATGGMALALTAVAATGTVAQAAIDAAEAGRLERLGHAAPLKGTELVSQAQADAKMMAAAAEIFAAVIAAIATAGVAWKLAVDATFTNMVRQMVADTELQEWLLDKVANKRTLVELLKKADSPEELKALLGTKDVATAGKLLDTRAAVRARLNGLRDRLEAKDVTDLNDILKDPARSDEASAKLDDLEAKLPPGGGGGVTFRGRPVNASYSNWTGWHGNNTSPEELQKSGGFKAHGANEDLYDHVMGAEDSAFRGTTATPLTPTGEGGAGHWGDYVYELDAGEAWGTSQIWEQNQSLATGGHRARGELEIAIRGNVSWERVRGWYTMKEGPLVQQKGLGTYTSRTDWEAAQRGP
jgi:hypothetical protein